MLRASMTLRVFREVVARRFPHFGMRVRVSQTCCWWKAASDQLESRDEAFESLKSSRRWVLIARRKKGRVGLDAMGRKQQPGCRLQRSFVKLGFLQYVRR